MSGTEPQRLPQSERNNAGEADSAHRARPRHIVVFGEPAAANAAKVADIMRTKEGLAVDNSSFAMFAASRPDRPDTRVYHRLGIATLDLSPDEQSRFERIDGVQIVENQERRLPPPIAVDGPPAPIHAAAASTQSPAGSPDAAWCLELIGVDTNPRVWSGRGISVALLDTGIDLHHPDLPRTLETESFVTGESVQDLNGHGTHCAGVIAASTRGANAANYGVAPDVDLIVGKVLDRRGRGWDDKILEAIDWAIDLGADIVSMSLVTSRQSTERYPAQYEAVAKALGGRVVFVAAAGNDSNDPHYLSPVGNPASCPSFLSVGAIDRLLRVAPFSCRELDPIGKLDVCAPGVAVRSAWPNGTHKLLSGTSMATPHVAGLAALLAERGGPSLRGNSLRQRVIATARQLGARRDFGYGLARFC